MAETMQLDANQLVGLLRQQRDVYQSLRTLSEKQRNLITDNRPDLLLSILKDRQDLVAALARLNEQLGPYRRNWDAMYARLPEPPRAEAAALLHDINRLLREILQSDQEDGALLATRKQAVSDEVAGLRGTATASMAYARPAGSPAPARADITG